MKNFYSLAVTTAAQVQQALDGFKVISITKRSRKRRIYDVVQYNRHTKRVNSTLTAEQYKKLVEYAAKEGGMKPTAFLKTAAFRYIESLKKQIIP
jgi:hypothetical protein